ncbi:hypothetical protein [Glycomyces sp. YM15]|uniref:hypothetical protein n=1 Tax=Glycomyces sp. YM15 TaxID=2800446 RepID=UPI001964CB36|nr:hypothetical protein [Glycomyces sp. YM15]
MSASGEHLLVGVELVGETAQDPLGISTVQYSANGFASHSVVFQDRSGSAKHDRGNVRRGSGDASAGEHAVSETFARACLLDRFLNRAVRGVFSPGELSRFGPDRVVRDPDGRVRSRVRKTFHLVPFVVFPCAASILVDLDVRFCCSGGL